MQLWEVQIGFVGGNHGFAVGTIYCDQVGSGANVMDRMVDGKIYIGSAGVCHEGFGDHGTGGLSKYKIC